MRLKEYCTFAYSLPTWMSDEKERTQFFARLASRVAGRIVADSDALDFLCRLACMEHRIAER
jgi:hypothetical protein